MSRRNSQVDPPDFGSGNIRSVHHRRKGSVKCQLKTKAAPKGAPAWKNMNKDKTPTMFGHRKNSAQNELEAIFAKRNLRSVTETEDNQAEGPPSVINVASPSETSAAYPVSARPKPPIKTRAHVQRLTDNVQSKEEPNTSVKSMKGMLGNLGGGDGSSSLSGPIASPKLSPKPPPKPLKVGRMASENIGNDKHNLDLNQNKQNGPPTPSKPKPAPKRMKPQVAVKPKPNVAPKTFATKNIPQPSDGNRRQRESVPPPPKPKRMYSEPIDITNGSDSGKAPIASQSVPDRLCNVTANDSKPNPVSKQGPTHGSWLHSGNVKGDTSGESKREEIVEVVEEDDLYQDVDDNGMDEGWEDCEEDFKQSNRLFIPSGRKSSAQLRHNPDCNRTRRRNRVTKSRHCSTPERKNSSGILYEDISPEEVHKKGSENEDWETDDSADSDGYEIVDQKLLNAIRKHQADKNKESAPAAEAPPPLPHKAKDSPMLPARTPSGGKGDLTFRVPKQRPPCLTPPVGNSPVVGRRRSVTSPDIMLPPLPRKGAPPPPVGKRPDVLDASTPGLPDKGKLTLRLDESVLGLRPPPPVPDGAPEPPAKGYTVIDSNKSPNLGGRSPGGGRSPIGGKSPVLPRDAPPVPPRSPAPGVTTPVVGGPVSPSLTPNTVVPPPARLPKTPAGKPPPVKALSSASLASRVPPPKRTPDRSVSEGPQFGFPEGYLKMGNSQATVPEEASGEPTDLYIDPFNDTDTHETDPQQKSTPEPFDDLWSNTNAPEEDYLVLLNDGTIPGDSQDDRVNSVASSLFSDEPLYQIYHAGVVARDVIGQSGEADEDEDYDDYYAIYEEAETVKNYVSTILSKGAAVPPPSKDEAIVEQPSSLEQVAKLGAGVRKLWCEMPEVLERGIIESITPAERKLQESMFEIITSEASYLKSLNMLVSHFMEAKEFSIENDMFAVVTKREHHVLFSNVMDVRRVSRSLLQELEALWVKNCVLNITDIAEILTNYAQNNFDAYVKYTSNQVYQERILTELIKKNFLVREVLMRLQSSENCKGLTIQSFLTLPMQRITRLPLLIDALCHRMDATHPDYETITSCLNVIQTVVRQCNEGARKMSNIEQITEIDRSLMFNKGKKIPLVNQSRYLVKKGQLTRLIKPGGKLLDKMFEKKKETLWLFLFNDLMIITKKKGTDQYDVKEHAPRISVHADLLSSEDIAKRYPSGIPGGCKNLFIMVLLEKNIEYILSCASMSEKTRWVEAVAPPMQANEDERIYEDWDCPQVQAIHQYTAKDSDELGLEESDVVNVFRKMADGWYEGERIRDGQRGWFPSNFTVEIQSAHMRAKNLRQRYRLMHGSE